MILIPITERVRWTQAETLHKTWLASNKWALNRLLTPTGGYVSPLFRPDFVLLLFSSCYFIQMPLVTFNVLFFCCSLHLTAGQRAKGFSFYSAMTEKSQFSRSLRSCFFEGCVTGILRNCWETETFHSRQREVGTFFLKFTGKWQPHYRKVKMETLVRSSHDSSGL